MRFFQSTVTFSQSTVTVSRSTEFAPKLRGPGAREDKNPDKLLGLIKPLNIWKAYKDGIVVLS
jgi:hypothetical protein